MLHSGCQVVEILTTELYKAEYEGVSKSFWTGRLERELQMVQLSATRCNCIAILWVSLVSFSAITLCVASNECLFLFLLRCRISPETFRYTLVRFKKLIVALRYVIKLLATCWIIGPRKESLFSPPHSAVVPPVNWESSALSLGIKWSERETTFMIF
jgi:hypothetical protein